MSLTAAPCAIASPRSDYSCVQTGGTQDCVAVCESKNPHGQDDEFWTSTKGYMVIGLGSALILAVVLVTVVLGRRAVAKRRAVEEKRRLIASTSKYETFPPIGD